MRHDNILGVIGDTPMVGVHALSPNPDVRIFAKLEGQNPGGSSKDRIALDGRDGRGVAATSTPGDTILEPSSGNTGIGLAMVARLRGYRLRVVMPENVSVERRQLLEIFGAEIVAVAGRGGQQRRASASPRSSGADDPSLVRLFQYGNPANPLAHYERTGPEIWRDCPEVDVFVAGLGTSGTLMGVGRYLKEQNPAVQVVAVEPRLVSWCRVCASSTTASCPRSSIPTVLDRKFIVRPRESIEWLRRLLDDCGVFAGVSSGAAVTGAAKMAAEMDAGTIVTLLPDGRMEVPLVGGVDRRARRGRRAARPASTTGERVPTPTSESIARSTCCAAVAWSPSRPRRSTASGPTRRRAAVRRLLRGQAPPGGSPRDRAPRPTPRLPRVGLRGAGRGGAAGGRVLAGAVNGGGAACRTGSRTRSPGAWTPSASACPTSPSRSSYCGPSVVGSPRRPPTASAG